MFETVHRHRRRPASRLGDRRPAARARRRASRRRTASSSSSACRTARSPRSRRSVEPGPWVAHVSGATPLVGARSARAALQRPSAADARPRAAGPSSSTVPARPSRRRRTRRASAALWLAEDARPRAVRRSTTTPRTLYHAGAVIASNYLVTLYRARGSLFDRGGRAARGARPAHAAHDRERLRADRADRARRLGDGRRAPRGAPRASAPSSSRCTACSRRRRRA